MDKNLTESIAAQKLSFEPFSAPLGFQKHGFEFFSWEFLFEYLSLCGPDDALALGSSSDEGRRGSDLWHGLIFVLTVCIASRSWSTSFRSEANVRSP